MLSGRPGRSTAHERWAGEKFLVYGVLEWVNRGETAIIGASRWGNVALVLELMKRSVEVNARGEEGWDALPLVLAILQSSLCFSTTERTPTPEMSIGPRSASLQPLITSPSACCLLLVARAADLYAVNAAHGQNALEAYGSKHDLTSAVKNKRRYTIYWSTGLQVYSC